MLKGFAAIPVLCIVSATLIGCASTEEMKEVRAELSRLKDGTAAATRTADAANATALAASNSANQAAAGANRAADSANAAAASAREAAAAAKEAADKTNAMFRRSIRK